MIGDSHASRELREAFPWSQGDEECGAGRGRVGTGVGEHEGRAKGMERGRDVV